MQRQINEKTKSAHFQIKNIWSIRKCLTEDATKTLVSALVVPKLDYCNSLLYGAKQSLQAKLQRTQNAAVRVIKKVRKRNHITPHLKDLHWLPVRYRIEFKILLLTYKSLHGLAPHYITELLKKLRNTRREQNKLLVPEINLKRTGSKAFSYSAPYLWNVLPKDIREAASTDIFKKKLKTFYFEKHFCK